MILLQYKELLSTVNGGMDTKIKRPKEKLTKLHYYPTQER